MPGSLQIILRHDGPRPGSDRTCGAVQVLADAPFDAAGPGGSRVVLALLSPRCAECGGVDGLVVDIHDPSPLGRF